MINVKFNGEITINCTIDDFIESFKYNHAELIDYINSECAETIGMSFYIDKIETIKKEG